MEERKTSIPKMKQVKNKRCSSQLKHNKVIINGEIFIVKNMKNLEGDNPDIKQRKTAVTTKKTDRELLTNNTLPGQLKKMSPQQFAWFGHAPRMKSLLKQLWK